MNRFVWLILLLMLLSSCSHQKEAKLSVEKFITAWKNSDSNEMESAYPNIKNLLSYYKTDNATISGIKAGENNQYEVIVHNKYTNGFGKTFEKDITFFTRPKSDDDKSVYIVYDSKGLCGYTEGEITNYFTFAKSVGAIKTSDKTDVQIAKAIQRALPLFADYFQEMKSYLRANIIFSNFNWNTSYYSDYASGSAVCKNNTVYNLPKLKYKVHFNRNGSTITEDDGYVSVDVLPSGQSKSFSIYSPNVGNANGAYLEPIIEDDFVTEIVANAHYNGNEYEEWKKQAQ